MEFETLKPNAALKITNYFTKVIKLKKNRLIKFD